MNPVEAVLLIVAGVALTWAVLSRFHAARLGELARRVRAAERVPAGDALGSALNEMMDRFRLRISELGDEAGRLVETFDGMDAGVLTLDPQQRIVLANVAASRLLGAEVSAPSGRALWELVRDEPLLDAVTQTLSSGQAKTVQLGPIRERHLTAHVAALPEGRAVLVVHDTTESARYQELRKEFVANVSHELRTPLTMIRGFVETLKEGAFRDPEKGMEFLSIIEKHAQLLTNLVENLLDLSRLESPQGLPRRVRVDLAGMVNRVMELRMPAARKKKQELLTELPSSLPNVLGDPDYIERAISNLVDNAIKYTPEGGSIRVTAARNGTGVRMEVMDTGIGIPEADLPRIFERFYRVDKSRSRDMGGTGLGLAIVKHVVQAHGGTVDVASRPGQGSTFRITLPYGEV